jgi:predicted metal-dependent hydrolase
MLGHWDPAHNAIIISRIFDRPQTPRFLLEYIVYHEMLHLKYPAEYRSQRRCVHTRAFKDEERKFPRYDEAVKLLKLL